MKAYLILCILLASILFFPSSLLARELAAGTMSPVAQNPNKPVTVPCKGKPYSCNVGPPKSPKPCKGKYYRGPACPPNSSP